MDAPTIVVITHSRPQSLERLLRTVARAEIDSEARLVISIDGEGDAECATTAEAFAWPHGPKEVINHGENLGLRDHVLACGDLTCRYGPIILLEDDVVVSPPFYAFTVELLRRYSDDDRIAGFSLYSQRHNETARCRFEPIDNGFAVYAAQLPSSWGEAFTPEQWARFRKWLAVSHTDPNSLPHNIQRWPESSWKRLMCAYTAGTSRWFVYPYVGFSTNCAEPGVHTRRQRPHLQAEMAVSLPTAGYPALDEAIKYDLWWELVEDGIEWDVYGMKHRLTGDRVLSSRRLPGYRQTQGFSIDLRPIQLNYYLGHAGDGFWLNERTTAEGVVDIEPSSRLAESLTATRADWTPGRGEAGTTNAS